MLEDNDDMLSELEVVIYFDYAVKALVIFIILRLHQLIEQLTLNIGIINIKLLVLTYLGSNQFLLRVFMIYALYDYTEGA